MKGTTWVLAGLCALTAPGVLRLRAAPSNPAFTVSVPPRMVTGRVLLQAQTTDENVTAVRWQVDEVTHTTTRPFDLVLDVGPVPHEKRVVAIACDKEYRPLYQQEAILNPGGQGLAVRILTPLHGQRGSGPVPVLVRVTAPAGDRVTSAVLDHDGTAVPLRDDDGLLTAVVDVPSHVSSVSVAVRTERGRVAEKTVLLNGRGFLTSLDAHAVDQVVGVYQRGRPLEDLKASDFSVRDDRGLCEIRAVKLVRDTPLMVGVSIDTSLSLLHTEALRQAAANQFLQATLKTGDMAFLQRFGKVALTAVDWTSEKELLKNGILELGYDSVPGTVLHDAVIRALYQFQGTTGARALVLITDGNAYDEDVPESQALAYARESGVKIYTLGLPWGQEVKRIARIKGPDGISRDVEDSHMDFRPANVEVLDRFARATGGRTFLIQKAEDLPGAFASIERDIRTQYLVSYITNARRQGTFHPVKVKTTRGRVETAAGFFY